MAATFVPRLLTNYPLTAPIVYLAFSVIAFMLFSFGPFPDLASDPYLGKRLTELGVIVSLTGVGLKLQRPLAWATWRISVRLLLVTMPITIAGVALIGWWGLGFAPATAVLLGAVLAPTDPVLASDVQTSAPLEEDFSSTRLALTTEAGLNDGLAFPFTHLAIALATVGLAPSLWLSDWLLNALIYKIVVGGVIGVVAGWSLAKLVFSKWVEKSYQKHAVSIGLLAISLTLFPYGLAEIVGSYGFIAVFVAACVFRQQESTHHYLSHLHSFSEQLEKILVLGLMLFLAAYLSGEYLAVFEWYMIPVAVIVLIVVRPMAGLIALPGSRLPMEKKLIISFFGIRGIGSVYYLLYAFYHADFPQHREAMALVVNVIVFSILIHGLLARPTMKKWIPEQP